MSAVPMTTTAPADPAKHHTNDVKYGGPSGGFGGPRPGGPPPGHGFPGPRPSPRPGYPGYPRPRPGPYRPPYGRPGYGYGRGGGSWPYRFPRGSWRYPFPHGYNPRRRKFGSRYYYWWRNRWIFDPWYFPFGYGGYPGYGYGGFPSYGFY